MVVTRRRSAVVKEDVEAAMEAMDAQASRSRLGLDEDLSQTRSPRTSNNSSTSKKKTSTSSRISEVASVRPSTPTRSKKLSESRPETPTRSKRLSESRPGTPTRSKRLSESVCLTPTRKSRRLSGSAPEETEKTPVLPLKKRRTSISNEVDRNDQDEPVVTENIKIPAINIIPPDSNLESIKEAEESDSEEIVSKETLKVPNIDSKLNAESSHPRDNPSEDSCDYHTAESEKSAEYLSAESEKSVEDVDEKSAKDVSTENETSLESTVPDAIDDKENINDIKEKESMTCVVEKKVSTKANTEYDILKKLQASLLNPIPRQKPKSGRFWKSERAQFRSLRKDKGNRRPFEHRLKLKEEKDRNREIAQELMQQKNQKKEDIRRRMEENKKKKEENQLKSEVFQVVKNPNKIKRMKKRDLAKRDLLGKV